MIYVFLIPRGPAVDFYTFNRFQIINNTFDTVQCALTYTIGRLHVGNHILLQCVLYNRVWGYDFRTRFKFSIECKI
jgi:hypothetical protein